MPTASELLLLCVPRYPLEDPHLSSGHTVYKAPVNLEPRLSYSISDFTEVPQDGFSGKVPELCVPTHAFRLLPSKPGF